MNRRKDQALNQFNEAPKVRIDAFYNNGNFFYLKSGNPIILKEKAICRLLTDQANLPDEMYEELTLKISREVLPSGTRLFIRMPDETRRLEYVLHLELLEPLKMEKKGMGKAKIISSRCKVIKCETSNSDNSRKGFVPFEAESLNQAFVNASIILRPKNKSHVTNIFKSCYTSDRKPLEYFRF